MPVDALVLRGFGPSSVPILLKCCGRSRKSSSSARVGEAAARLAPTTTATIAIGTKPLVSPLTTISTIAAMMLDPISNGEDQCR